VNTLAIIIYKMSNEQKSKKGKGKKNGNSSNRNNKGGADVSSVPVMQGERRITRLHHLVPDKVIVPLRYVYNGVITQAGFNTASKSFKMNSAFDIDPSVGSQAIPGFAEWAAFYQNYRVRRVKFKVEMLFRDNTGPLTGSMGVVCPAITPFSANTFTIANWEQAFSKICVLTSINGKPIVMRGNYGLHQLVGDPACYTDDDYAAATSTNPANLVFLHVGISTEPVSGVMTNGLGLRCEIYQDTEFYNRRVLAA